MKTTIRKFAMLALPALVLTLGACDDDTVAPAQPETVVDVAISVNESTGEFSTLIAALVAADLVATLSGPGPFTVFAPTDAAFAELNLNASNIGSLPVETLTAILLYHVAPARRNAANVTAASSITMASGGTTVISVTSAGAFINDAQIVQTDVEAANGIIHVIDAVLMP
ncbi:MAG: fasciclin domain-containing protein [Gemmatimonadetes bacterium]|nr:fasciclin domain-containing protein [Gemmatimonadota bacterium]